MSSHEAELKREPGTLETDDVLVRNLKKRDLEDVVKIDQKTTGRSRLEYYNIKLKEALESSGVKISLACEIDGHVVGFLIGSVYYGEFGHVEPSAIIDSIGVDPDYRGRHAGTALLKQMRTNMKALNVTRIRTQVSWRQFDLMKFFSNEGFTPSDSICLEVDL